MADSDTPSAPTAAPRHVRKLVTIRRITGIEKDKKRNREFARVGGWTVLVAPKRFRAGDHVMYFEIDSFLPRGDGRWWELVARDKCTLGGGGGEEGYRVRSRRVGDRVSQGLVFPLAEFPEIAEVWEAAAASSASSAAVLEEMAFEDMLGVRKYVARMDYAPYASLGPAPAFIRPPAWERAQNIPDLFRTRGGTAYQITEKLDGWSMSVYWVRHGSR